jgi:hypothetical protein
VSNKVMKPGTHVLVRGRKSEYPNRGVPYARMIEVLDARGVTHMLELLPRAVLLAVSKTAELSKAVAACNAALARCEEDQAALPYEVRQALEHLREATSD